MHRRAILRSDINCCYAQIECQAHPELRGRPVSVGFRRAGDLSGFTRQAPTALSTNITAEVARCAWELFRANAGDLQEEPLRAIHVWAGRIAPAADELQLSLFDPMPRRAWMERLDAAIDELRRRFGNKCVVWGPQALDADAWANDAHGNVVHPVGFFRR